MASMERPTGPNFVPEGEISGEISNVPLLAPALHDRVPLDAKVDEEELEKRFALLHDEKYVEKKSAPEPEAPLEEVVEEDFLEDDGSDLINSILASASMEEAPAIEALAPVFIRKPVAPITDVDERPPPPPSFSDFLEEKTKPKPMSIVTPTYVPQIKTIPPPTTIIQQANHIPITAVRQPATAPVFNPQKIIEYPKLEMTSYPKLEPEKTYEIAPPTTQSYDYKPKVRKEGEKTHTQSGLPLQSASISQKAITEGTAHLVMCLECNGWMSVTKTATLVWCPNCEVVSPVLEDGGNTKDLEGGNVATMGKVGGGSGGVQDMASDEALAIAMQAEWEEEDSADLLAQVDPPSTSCSWLGSNIRPLSDILSGKRKPVTDAEKDEVRSKMTASQMAMHDLQEEFAGEDEQVGLTPVNTGMNRDGGSSYGRKEEKDDIWECLRVPVAAASTGISGIFSGSGSDEPVGKRNPPKSSGWFGWGAKQDDSEESGGLVISGGKAYGDKEKYQALLEEDDL